VYENANRGRGKTRRGLDDKTVLALNNSFANAFRNVIIFLTFALQPHVENTRFLLNIELIKLLPVSRSYQVVVSQFDGLLMLFSSPVAVVDLMSMSESVAQQFVFNNSTAS
jgi:hypothetical protein